VQLTDGGFVGSRTSRYGDEEGGGFSGDAAEMALLGPTSGRHAGDRFSVGGFNPEILGGLGGEEDDSNIR
jgi:hypothetical protein